MARLLSSSGRRGALGKLLHLPHDVGSVLGLLVVEHSGCAIVDDDAEAARDASIDCSIRDRDDDLCGTLLLQGSGHLRIKGVDVECT